MPSECGKWIRPSTSMSFPRPTPQAALAKSPKPSTETTTASWNGETWNAEDRCAKMVLDLMEFGTKGLSRQSLAPEAREFLVRARAGCCRRVQHQADIEWMTHEIFDLPHAVGAAIQIDRDMVHIAEAQAGFAQAIGNRLRREILPNA